MSAVASEELLFNPWFEVDDDRRGMRYEDYRLAEAVARHLSGLPKPVIEAYQDWILTFR